jgi:rhodanese-related sulfurtransferase
MKICYACENKSLKIDKITEEAIIGKKVVGWKVKRGEYTVAPNDSVPFLIGIREKIPEKYDTKSELNLGNKYANRWIYYWAANKASSYIIKQAPDAYGLNYTNMGITKSDNNGKIIFKLECPQPYSVNGKTYYPHIHFMISNKKNENWELKVRTINIICNLNRQQVKNASKNKSYLIINALPKEYFEKQHIPNSINLYYEDALNMTDKKIDIFIKENLQYLNNDLKKLIDNKKLSIKDIPILVYCYSKTCDAGKKLSKRLNKANYHKIVEYQDGITGFFK